MSNVDQIKWTNRLRGDNGSLCKVSIDGTDFRRMHSDWKRYRSHKFDAPALRYEVGIAIQSGDIVWINGPFPAGRYNDIVIFRDKLKDKLEFCKEKVEADDGYRGEEFYIELPRNVGHGGHAQKRIKGLVRTRHETCNKRFKNWRALSERFRHSSDLLHGRIFRSIVAITQLQFEHGNPLFQVEYRTLETNQGRKNRLKMLELVKQCNR